MPRGGTDTGGATDPPTLTASGLTSAEAADLLARHGPNEQPRPRRRTLVSRVWTQVRDPMILVLLAAGTFTALVGDVSDSVIIAVVVLVNSATGVLQELRAERAIDALSDLVAPTARVHRDGVVARVPAREIVPGDLMLLAAGDRVAADARVVATHDLQVDESAMTGESLPVALADGDEVAAGTSVTAGRADVVVTRTGAESGLGRLAALIAATPLRATPLQRRLAQLSRVVVVGVLSLTVVVMVEGLLLGRSVVQMALVGVSLAVAAVPESLPAVVVVSLALGAHRMARRQAVVRRLPAVETLGAVTVIATDKTGTLTEGRMVAERLWTPAPGAEAEQHLLRDAVLCNDARVLGDGVTEGEPLERAVLDLARERGLDIEAERGAWRRFGEEPFDNRSRRMRTWHRGPDGAELVVEKGAPEVVLDGLAGSTDALAAVDLLAADGYRVLAVAERLQRDDGAGGRRIVGLVGIVDPPRAAAADVVADCRRAGIRVVLVTGDHPGTARAIADRVGIEDTPEAVGIHARVRPEDKATIVNDLQRDGEVVAMLGDGVNDAPALRRADIGVAAGRGGTEVARQAADLVLLDDDFRTVVAAVEEGRRIYANIRTFLVYGLSGGVAEVGVMLCGPIIGTALPLLPAQILWINLLTHGPTGVALAVDPADPSQMAEPPRPPDEPVLHRPLVVRLALAATLLVATSVTAALLVGTDGRRTATFLALGLGQLGVALAVRASGRAGRRNYGLFVAIAGSAALLLLGAYLGPFQALLHTQALGAPDLGIVLALAAVPGLVVGTVVRRARRRRLRLANVER
ncbi:MAG TPA: cation-translocating P-type ATPase [Nocardioides sp.]|nr:cation-translocating P-type ATPase [Nocardioides sp.]